VAFYHIRSLAGKADKGKSKGCEARVGTPPIQLLVDTKGFFLSLWGVRILFTHTRLKTFRSTL